MQINRAESGRASPSHVGCGLQNVQLGSQSSSKIAFRNIETFICRLNIIRLRFEHAVSLLEIKQGAAHFRGAGTASGYQGLHACFAPGAWTLIASFTSR